MNEATLRKNTVLSEDSTYTAQADVLRMILVRTVCALVEKPEEVAVETCVLGGGIILRLSVAPIDVGRIIGKQGQTARSLRVVMTQAAHKRGCRASLEIAE